MALFHFNSNKEIRLDNNHTSGIVGNGVNSQYPNTVWEGELQDMPIGDGFVKDTKTTKPNIDPNGREYIEHQVISPLFSMQDYEDLRDPQKREKVHENKILKIKSNIRQQFPVNQYDVEVFWDGRFYIAYIYDISTRPEPPKLSQSTSITRPDGIKIGMKDSYEGDINDDDNGEFIDARRQDSFSKGMDEPVFTITLADGKEYTFKTLINGSRSLIDIRRQEKAITEFFAEFPKEKIQELIDKHVTYITFDTEPDEDFADLYELDENGECVRILDEDDVYVSAEIISPKFAPPKHNYRTEQYFERDDGYKFTMVDNSQASSDMIIEIPEGTKQIVAITSNSDDFDTDCYHQILMPKLSNILKDLPQDVVNDMLNEIDEIKITINAPNAGVYAKGSNVLSVDLYDDTPGVVEKSKGSFIHELGHAIDNYDNQYLSDSPEFLELFNEFKKLAEKYEYEILKNNEFYKSYYGEFTFEQYQNGIPYEGLSSSSHIRNHALDNSHEFFASTYANIYNAPETNGDYIAELDKIILPFKNSDDAEKKHCYELYMNLKKQVKIIIGNVRNGSHSERADNKIKNIVSKMGKDIHDDLEFLYSEYAINLTAYSPELTITNIVSRNSEEFAEIISSYKQSASNENYPEEIRKAFSRIVEKLQEIRNCIVVSE